MNTAIYCRISRDRAGGGLGVARQEADCRKLCESRGWTVGEVYVDNDISASSGKTRPGFVRLMGDMKQGRFGAVVAYHNDRLLRSPRELEDFIDAVEAAGVEVATVMGGEYDLSTGTGKMSARIVGAVARAEADRLSERVRRKHLDLAQSGQVSGGGSRPFGFEPDFRTVVESEAVLVREAADRFLAGEALYAITADWNRRGVTTAGGARWIPSNLRRLLASGRIGGKRSHHGEITAIAEWPAIVDPTTWARLQARLGDPSRKTYNGAPRSYLLTGLAFCGLCGHRLIARPARHQRCYICPNGANRQSCGGISIRADLLEGWVVKSMFDTVNDDDITPPDDIELAPLLDAASSLRSRLDELSTDYYADQTISKAQFFASSRRLTGELEQVEAEIAKRSATRARPVSDLRKTWETEPFSVKRAAIEGLVQRVTVNRATGRRNRFNPERITIEYLT